MYQGDRRYLHSEIAANPVQGSSTVTGSHQGEGGAWRLFSVSFDSGRPSAFFAGPKKLRPAFGEGWPRANRSGTGRGGDVTGSRVRKFLVSSASWRWRPPGGYHRARPTRWDRPATGV